jgi:hypothetical protein
MFQYEREFAEIFDDRNDASPEFGGEHCGLDVTVILEAVADDQAIGRVLAHSHDGE